MAEGKSTTSSGPASNAPSFDAEAANKYYAAHCFNGAWKLLGLAERSPEDDEALIASGHTSLWHWRQRPDCTDRNIAVAYWMLARIYATVGVAERALHYADRCMALTRRAALSPFYLGAAHEVLARAHRLAKNESETAAHLLEARQITAGLTGGEHKILTTDLDELEGA
jgi:ATP/maltotriose-dependent transcriptional regulator MalT